MSVVLSDVRTQISDRPQLWPVPGDPPEFIGTGDGTATIFSLRFENYIPNTLTIYEATSPAAGSGGAPAWAAISSSLYVIGSPGTGPNQTGASNATVTFTTAPIVFKLIGARYQVTAFSDADLLNYLARAQAAYSDDTSILKRVQYDLIDVVLMDYDRQMILSQGEYRKDPAAYAASLRTLQQKLQKDLSGGPVAGLNVPALGIGSQVTRRYSPLR